MIRRIANSNLEFELKNIGVHPGSIPIFRQKAEIVPLKLLHVRTPAANIIKQELLAAGGDAAINAGCVAGKGEYGDILLLGTAKHYKILLKKMGFMSYFGIPGLKDELNAFLHKELPHTVLADGRVLTYEQIVVMGILNITPDSFYEASRVPELTDTLKKAGEMLAYGAKILDVGGESSRPGAESVSPEEECRRVVPVIAALKREYPECIVSVDTYHAATAQAALEAGADILNDITAATFDQRMLAVAHEYQAPLILMHMRGTPKNMQELTEYANVTEEVAAYLCERAEAVKTVDYGADKIILDPGIGFAKNYEQNLQLLHGLGELCGLGYPVLLAASRKSTIGHILGGLPPEERLYGTLATSCQAVISGAQLVRVHDVKANTEAIRMLEAIRKCR